jgi:hypothetical protein
MATEWQHLKRISVSDPDQKSFKYTAITRKLDPTPPLRRAAIALRRQGRQFESAWGHSSNTLVRHSPCVRVELVVFLPSTQGPKSRR